MKTRILCSLATLALTLLCSLTQAQDAHFSQYFASPMYTNPALTGQINGNFRLNALYRTQWNPFKDYFNTASFSADARVKQYGFGVTVVNQLAGTNNLNNLTFVISGSYDISAKSNSNQHFVVGVQGGIYNKSFNNKNVTLPGDYVDGVGPINNGPNREDLSNLSVLSPDINFGFMWFNGSSKLRYTPFAGASVFHLLQPYDSFNKDKKLAMRYLVHGGLRYRTNASLDLTPHFKAEYQDGAYNAIVGLNASYTLTDTETSIEGGLAYRIDDAIVPYVGATVKDLSFGLSYDANTSQLSTAGNRKGTLEISLTYINRTNKLQKKFICPRL